MSSSPLLPLLAVGALQLAAWGLGRPLLTTLVPSVRGTTWGALDAFQAQLLGFTALATFALALAFTGLLVPLALAPLVGAPAIAGALQLARSRPWRRFSIPTAAELPAMAAFLFVLLFLPTALSPVLHHDDNVYHLLLPRLYVDNGGFVDLPTNLYANMPHLAEILYALPLALADFTAPKVLVLSFVLWTLVGLWGATRSSCGTLGTGVLLLAIVAGKNLQWHLGLAYVEPLLGALFLGAALALVAWRRSGDAGWLVVLSLEIGFAAACKYTAWFFAALLGGAALASLWRHGRPGQRWRPAVAMAVAFGGLWAPWVVRGALLTGNPVYPVLYRLFGGRFWSEAQSLHYRLAVQANAGGLDKSWLDYLAVPFNLTLRDNFYNGPSFSIGLMVLFLVALVVAFRHRHSDDQLPWIPALALAGFLLWLATVSQGRYLFAWVPVMALVAGRALAPLRHRPRGLLAVLVLVLAAGAYQLVFQLYPYHPLPEAMTAARAELLPYNHNYRLCRLLDEIVPTDGRVLAMWENRFFFLHREVEVDGVYQAPTGLARLREADDAAELARRLAARQITHVVVHGGEMARYVENRYAVDLVDPEVYPRERFHRDLELLREFLTRELEPVADLGPHRIFRLRAAAPTGPRPDSR